MNCRVHLIISFGISMALHGVILLAVVGFVMASSSRIVPGFRSGMSSVMVVVVDPPQSESKVPAMPELKAQREKTVESRSLSLIVKKPLNPAPVVKKQDIVTKLEVAKPSPARQPEVPMPTVTAAPELDNMGAVDEPDRSSAVVSDKMPDSLMKDEAAAIKNDSDVAQSQGGNDIRKGVQDFADSESFVDVHPSYPLGARLRGEEGLVVVRVSVSPSGRVEKVEVVKSSGYAALDDSALDAMKRARFVAKNGAIQGGEVTLPFRFKLVN